MQYHLRKCVTAALAAVFMIAAGAAQAESPNDAPGFGGSSANPEGRGVGKNGGSGIHSIEDAPGQGGNNEEEDRPAGNMHGGLAGATGYSK